ncbi:MAG: hypothetical protein Q9157_004431 [Trypethelium eluteriae]
MGTNTTNHVDVITGLLYIDDVGSGGIKDREKRRTSVHRIQVGSKATDDYRRFLPIDHYQVGVICALHHELAAAMAILDERHQQLTGQDKLDENNYVLGRVYEHNVVIACLPAGVYGTNSAARVARDMVRTFTGLRFGLMIGIGGGIPNLQRGLDIRLGDVVISQPDQIHDQQSRLTKEHLEETKRENQKHDQRYQSSKDRDCHQALKTSKYEQFKDVNPDRVEGTCQWVLSHPRYHHWAAKEYDDLLWISADPGCGKSVLAKSLVDNELRATDKHIVCYFFFKDNEEQDRLATALCALLHQLISYRPQLTRYIMPAWERNGHKIVEETRELWRTFLAAAKSDMAFDVTCVLDALDECRPTDRQLLIDMLAQFYKLISPSTSTICRGRLRFLVTSRPYDDIRTEFQKTLDDLPIIRLRGEEENDRIHQEIDLVIQKRVEELAKNLRLDSQTKNKLSDKLLEMQHRTYLWLHLAIEGIYETFRDSIRPKEASVELLPSTVDDAYEKILTRVSEKQRVKVKKILQIIVGARRPLTIQEMAIALGIATVTNPKSIHEVQLPPDHLENNIRHWCGLFIFINHTRIYLIHQTAKEFLLSNRGPATFPSRWKHCLDPRGIEKEMARICVDFLCLKDSWPVAELLVRKFQKGLRMKELLDEKNDAESLLAYTAENWPYHFREADIPTGEPIIAQVSRLYQTDSTLHRLWFAIYWRATHLYEAEPQMNSTHLAAVLGHSKILEWMLQSDQYCDIRKPDEAGRLALTWASRCGHDKTVETLLDWGADVNLQGGDHGNALYIASEWGHEKVVEVLLERGADVDAPGANDDTALYAASWTGHEKIAELLLNNRADVNSRGKHYGSALNSAARYGEERVAKLLLDRGASPNLKDTSGRTALSWAAAHGKLALVEMLLEHEKVDQRSRDHFGQTPLQLAAGNGHEAIVKLLIAENLDSLFSNDNFGRTPLSCASKRGHSKIVQLIHERYQENGITIRDEDTINFGPPPVSNQRGRIHCDVCLVEVPDVNVHYHCEICDDGNFDVCQYCHFEGAFCLDDSHKLIKRAVEDDGFVELDV